MWLQGLAGSGRARCGYMDDECLGGCLTKWMNDDWILSLTLIRSFVHKFIPFFIGTTF